MQDSFERIRRSGLKLTPRRKAMVALFSGHDGPLSPREVQCRLKNDFKQCGLPGIYRNLETLADCGVLFRVVSFGRERSYAFSRMTEENAQGHHHHIICVSCGRVGQVDDCRYHEGMTIGGFRIVDHVLQIRGVCETCTETKGAHS
jgi:Fe2+ or Zn2+ uptake regulation protein